MAMWRRYVVRAVLLVFLVQCFGAFATSPRNVLNISNVSEDPTLSRLGAIHADAMIDCPHHKADGEGSGHSHQSDGCPMCQMLGCALAGAPPVSLIARSNERLVGLLSTPAPSMPPRAPPLEDARPRGPPVRI
jgi:hypothetical protein